jgi:hypothetical protein
LSEREKVVRAIEKAFDFSEHDDYIAQCNKWMHGNFTIKGEVWSSLENLLEWVEAEK